MSDNIQGWIYKITNTINGKVYVGKTESQKEYRWSRHKSILKRNKHYNKHLQSSWNKYGEEAFKFEVIEKFNSEMNFSLDCLERYWIKQYDSMNPEKGYNLTKGGEGASGAIRSKELKKHLSDMNKGKRSSPNTEFKKGQKAWNSKKVVCLNNGNIYESAHQAGRELNCRFQSIASVCRGERNHTKGLKFKYLENEMGQ